MKGLLRFVSKCSSHIDRSFLFKTLSSIIIFYKVGNVRFCSFFVRKFMFFLDWYRENYRLNQKASDIKARSHFLMKLSTLQEIFFLSDLVHVVQIWVKITQG